MCVPLFCVAGFANNAAVAFEVQLQQSFAPLVAMAAMIHVQPYFPALATRFDEIAAELIAQVRMSKLSSARRAPPPPPSLSHRLCTPQCSTAALGSWWCQWIHYSRIAASI